jgi:hypothetical protein
MATSKELRVENLRALVREFRTADAVAQRAGTAPMYLSQILNGALSSTGRPRGVGDALARKLEQGCGKDVGWMDRAHGADQMPSNVMRVVAVDPDDQDFIQIPMVELRLSAGITGFQTEPDRRDGGTMGVRRSWVERGNYSPDKLVAIKIHGESMEPSLYEGDVVVINTADMRPTDGAVFAVNYEGEAVVKRFSRDAGDWWLMSDNPDQRKYHRKICRGDACIIVGRVVRKESDRI